MGFLGADRALLPHHRRVGRAPDAWRDAFLCGAASSFDLYGMFAQHCGVGSWRRRDDLAALAADLEALGEDGRRAFVRAILEMVDEQQATQPQLFDPESMSP